MVILPGYDAAYRPQESIAVAQHPRYHEWNIFMSLDEVAKRAKVSSATVSRVLNNLAVVKNFHPRSRDQGGC